MNWVESKDQQFPDDAQQFENFNRNGNNEYLGVVWKEQRRRKVLVTIPICLWRYTITGEYYWTECGGDDLIEPIKWALMPLPTQPKGS